MGTYATEEQIRDNLVKFQDPISAAKLTPQIIETQLSYVEGRINAYCRKLYVVPFVPPIDMAITELAVDITTMRILRRFFAQTPKRSDLEKDMADIVRRTLLDIVPDKNGKVNLLLAAPLISVVRRKPDGTFVYTDGWQETDFNYTGVDSSVNQEDSTNYFNTNTEFGDNTDAVKQQLDWYRWV